MEKKLKRVELTLVEPMYSTYHIQGPGTAILASNPSIRNWYLNEVFILMCTKKFLSGYTTPEIDIFNSNYNHNPHLDKRWFMTRFLNGYVHKVIRNLVDAGYCVYFNGVDDYYVEGKSWFKEKHFRHDGAICGYDQNDKSYCIYAYDKNWIYQKFWTPQKAFERGRKAVVKEGVYGIICGIKPAEEQLEFSPSTVLTKIGEYLSNKMPVNAKNKEDAVYGITVHDYIATYVEKLFDGSIPYERMDRRVFRLIWEHKKAMLERLCLLESALSLDNEISKGYEAIVKEADTMRMLYASHHMKRRDSVLPIIAKKLRIVKEEEKALLTELLQKTKGDHTQ